MRGAARSISAATAFGLRLDDRPEQRLLVGEMVVERAARYAGRRDDVGCAGLSIALFGEKPARRGDQIAARGLGALAVGASCDILLHTYSLYVN